jgi:hypothetical protein
VTTTAGYAVWTLVDEGTSMSMRTKFRSQTLSDPDFAKQCDTPTVIATGGTGSLKIW